MAAVRYLCQTDQHNKFWQYEVNGNSVHIKWGRVGGTEDEQTKEFGSPAEMQKFINKKVRGKEKKGYEKVTEEKLKKEEKTAKALGAQHKIKRMLWTNMKGNTLQQLDQYDPNKYVYVEILNSWSKKVTRLILAKDDTYMVKGGVSESSRNITFESKTKLGYSSFASAVRDVLKEMSEVVAEALKSVKFAAMGSRDLFGESEAAPDVQAALADIDTSGFDSSVVSKFASLGARQLQL